MKYAVQVYTSGWLYVMDTQGEKVLTFDTRDAAEAMAKLWRLPTVPDAVRVVEYEVS